MQKLEIADAGDSMQAELNRLYETLRERWIDMSDEVYEQLAGPALIWVSPSYIKASSRVVIIGKEEWGTDYSFREFISTWTVERAIACYHKFNYGEGYYNTPFWQFYNKLCQRVYGDRAMPGIIAWTNLVKFITNEHQSIVGTPLEDRALIIQDGMLAREIEILRPDSCLFVTGPDYDHLIQKSFPGAQFAATESPELGSRQLAEVHHSSLPARCFRTYHPKALRLQGIWDPVLDALSRRIEGR